MQTLENRIVAITGAGSGIGRALALVLAKRGARLALSDVNEAGLLETVAQCALPEPAIHHQCVDVSNPLAMQAWAEAAVEYHGHVHVIINNAGVALNASVENMATEDFHWLMGINFWGVVYGTKAFLPIIKLGDWGHIVNISSLFGLVGVPNQSAYNAAKFAVRGFTESLHMEMGLSDYNIGVSCVHPGGVATNIANAARRGEAVGVGGKSLEEQTAAFNEEFARTTPDEAAAIIADAIVANKPRVLVGRDALLGDLLARLVPTWYRKVLVLLYFKP